MSNPRTIFLLDDNPEFLQSANWFLQSAGFATQAFSCPDLALQALQNQETRVDCLLLDVRMPKLSGLAFHDLLLRANINLPVVYMTGHADVPLAVQAMRKGAITFIEKPFAPGALQAALAQAFTQSSVAHSLARQDSVQTEFASRLASLTAREREVLSFIVQSESNKAIARMLGISIKTVEWHRKNGMHKLGVASGIELTRRVTLAQMLP